MTSLRDRIRVAAAKPAAYLNCPRDAEPTVTRREFVKHVRTAHGVDLDGESILYHGVSKWDDGKRFYSIAEAAYSDSICLFDSYMDAQRQDDRTHTHVACVRPNAEPNVATRQFWNI